MVPINAPQLPGTETMSQHKYRPVPASNHSQLPNSNRDNRVKTEVGQCRRVFVFGITPF